MHVLVRKAALLAIALVALALPGAANAQTPGVVGYATGTALHVDAVTAGTTRVADVEQAFSGATFNSGSIAPAVSNEMKRVVQPPQPGKYSYGRGSGLEVGVATTPAGDGQVLAGKAEAVAPPPANTTKSLVGPVAVPPAVAAEAASGEARALVESGDPCSTLGSEMSFGDGSVANAQLVTSATGSVVGTSAPTPDRAVSETKSRTMLIPQIDGNGNVVGSNFGVMSEVRQTIAPVTLLAGTPNQTTIEVLGEWVLQAVAGGLPGTAYVHYGPAAAGNDTPVLRIINAAGVETRVLTLQQLTTGTGTTVAVPGVLELTIGEDPRAIGGDAASAPTGALNGTTASAAVDVVRVNVLIGDPSVAGLRIGHFETLAQVPAGGISCPLPVTKVAAPANPTVGEPFTVTITVNNPFDCPVTNITLTDTISREGAARFQIVGTTGGSNPFPTGTGLTNATVVWPNKGPLAPNGSLAVTVTQRASAAGIIKDTVQATGRLECPPGSALGDARVSGKALGASLSGGAVGLAVSGTGTLRTQVRQVLGARLARTGPAFPPASTVAVLLVVAALFAVIRFRTIGGRR